MIRIGNANEIYYKLAVPLADAELISVWMFINGKCDIIEVTE